MGETAPASEEGPAPDPPPPPPPPAASEGKEEGNEGRVEFGVGGAAARPEEEGDREGSSSVRVAVRIRPFLPSEAGTSGVVDVQPPQDHSEHSDHSDGPHHSDHSEPRKGGGGRGRSRRRRRPLSLPTTLQMGGPAGPRFTYDAIHPPGTSQADLYLETVAPLVRQCLRGYNATVLAYGQTGSGKTYTILGPQLASADESSGIIPRALRDLFEVLEGSRLNPPKSTAYAYEVRLQFLELYGEEIRDLLVPHSPGLRIRDVGGGGDKGGGAGEPEVVGASEVVAGTAREALLCLARGMLRRVTGATAMNAESSRSHAIMTAIVEQTATTTVPDGDGADEDGREASFTRSKFHFVDLAGSERARRTQATGHRLKEGIDINKGLLVLGNVISALGDRAKVGRTFVPYRDSKLTRLLRGSLGGNHRTLMVACVSPSSSNFDESLNCLRYANRARNIQNRAIVNVDPTTRLVSELRGRVRALAVELLRVRAVAGEEGAGEAGPLTDELLQILASGGDAATAPAPAAAPAAAAISAGSGAGPPLSASGQSFPEIVQTLQQRLGESDAELSRMTSSLKRARQETFQQEEGLYAAKAEAQYWRIKCHDGNEGGEGSAAAEEDGITNRFAAYEEEISKLKADLRDARSRADLAAKTAEEGTYLGLARAHEKASTARTRQPPPIVSLPVLSEVQEARQDKRHATELDEEHKVERENFEKATKMYLSEDEDENEGEEGDGEDSDDAEGVFMVGKQGEEALDLEQVGTDVVDVETTASVESFLRRQSHMDAHLIELTNSISAKEDLMEQLAASQRRYESMRQFYERKLSEMVEQVEARETERGKLETQIADLKKEGEDSESETFKALKAQLDKKDHQLKKLRRRQTELTGLTMVPSRNEAILARLKSDIASMKRQKVDLQKQVSLERKAHLVELNKLKKDAIQQSRETAKWKAASKRQEGAAERARNAAKAHLGEVNKLRSRYRESEKKLRVATLKRGVMERVGLDPILTGRRNSTAKGSRPATAPPTSAGVEPQQDKKSRRSQSSSIGTIDDIDVDRVRSFLDSKVSDVGEKEATAGKLAKEWEEHLELSTTRDRLLEEAKDNVGGTDAIAEELEALMLQLRYREGRIKNLSKRLGNGRNSKKGEQASFSTMFLREKEFKDMCAGAPPLSTTQLTCKILFGMVVKERRRVASLAQTASVLDKRAGDAERLAEAREDALRSHVEEERNERVAMAQTQQEQIVSLMAMVQEGEEGQSKQQQLDSTKSIGSGEDIITSESGNDTNMVMILSNERISALELQLAELQGEKEAKEVYKRKEADAKEELEEEVEKCNELHRELEHLKASLRQIRDALFKEKEEKPPNERDGVTFSFSQEDDASTPSEKLEMRRVVEDIIQEALHPPTLSPRKGAAERSKLSTEGRLHVARTPTTSSELSSRINLMEISDSDDEEIPEWAEDIMDDLAIIAKGEIPPSLKEKKKEKEKEKKTKKKKKGKTAPTESISKTSKQGTDINETEIPRDDLEGNVFVRLTAPENFTGAQKKAFSERQSRVPEALSDQDVRSGKILDGNEVLEEVKTAALPKPEAKAKAVIKPVFDRLTDPEYFTGVQKQSFMSSSHRPRRVVDGSIVEEGVLTSLNLHGDKTFQKASPQESNQLNGTSTVSSHPEGPIGLVPTGMIAHAKKTVRETQYLKPLSIAVGSDQPSSPEDMDTGHRSVFDRLVSPSNYTGTQKKIHTNTKNHRGADDNFVLGQKPLTIPTADEESDVSPTSIQQSTPRVDSDDQATNEEMESLRQSRERTGNYTQQDVFERLTKTVTHSYAVKRQNEAEETRKNNAYFLEET